VGSRDGFFEKERILKKNKDKIFGSNRNTERFHYAMYFGRQKSSLGIRFEG
jgi:hypothetical protein